MEQNTKIKIASFFVLMFGLAAIGYAFYGLTTDDKFCFYYQFPGDEKERECFETLEDRIERQTKVFDDMEFKKNTGYMGDLSSSLWLDSSETGSSLNRSSGSS